MERQRVDELLEMNMSLQMDLKRPSHSAVVTQNMTHLYSELESDDELQEPKCLENHGEGHFLIYFHEFMPEIVLFIVSTLSHFHFTNST